MTQPPTHDPRDEALLARARAATHNLKLAVSEAQAVIDDLSLRLSSPQPQSPPVAQPAAEPTQPAAPSTATMPAPDQPVQAQPAPAQPAPAPAQSVPAQPAAAAVAAPSASPYPQYPGTPAARPGQPAGYAPQQKPTKPPLTTEQKVLRTLAVLGSIITLLGVGFFVALTFGILGPSARAVFIAMMAAGLLGAGVVVDRRKGPSAGVTALYVTSFFVWVADIFYIHRSELEWIGVTAAASLHLVLWVGYLALALVRRNWWLPIFMFVGFFLYVNNFTAGYVDDLKYTLASQLITTLTVPLALGATMLVKPDDRDEKVASVRALAGIFLLLMAFMPVWNAKTGFLASFNLALIWLLILGLFLIAVEVFSPIRRSPEKAQESAASLSTDLTQIAHVANMVALPLLAGWSTAAHMDRWEFWFVPVTAALALGLVLYHSRSASSQAPENAQDAPMAVSAAGAKSNPFVIAWMMILAAAFIPLHFEFAFGENNPSIAQEGSAQIKAYLVLIAFSLTFIGVAALLKRDPEHRAPVVLFWGAVLGILTADLLPPMLYSNDTSQAVVPGLIRSLILLAIIGALLTQRWIWDGHSSGVTTAFGAGFLYFSSLAVVNLFIALAGLASVDAKHTGFIIGHAIISISWIAIASWLLLTRKPPVNDQTALTAGLVLAVASAVKLVFFDLASLSGITRVLAFTISGILLLAVAVMRAQRNPGDRGNNDVGTPPSPQQPQQPQQPQNQQYPQYPPYPPYPPAPPAQPGPQESPYKPS